MNNNTHDECCGLNRKNLFALIVSLIASLYYFAVIPQAHAEVARQQDVALQPYDLSYAASYNGMGINVQRTLSVQSNRYTLNTTAKNLLSSITEQGDFLVTKNGIIVDQSYDYNRSILGISKTESLTYDYQAGQAKYKSKKKKRQVALKEGYLNRLTYQVQLRRDLINGVSPLQYQVISRGRLKSYHFERQGEETLETPLGNIKTIKVKRIREDDDRETLLWFAPQWNYLLVQLWQREDDGEDYKIVFEKGTVNNQKISSR